MFFYILLYIGEIYVELYFEVNLNMIFEEFDRFYEDVIWEGIFVLFIFVIISLVMNVFFFFFIVLIYII